MARGLFTPPAFTPKTSIERNQQTMEVAFKRVTGALENYNGEVQYARNLQARIIVDALYKRWAYQVVHYDLALSFGEWVLSKHDLQSTYAELTSETTLWTYTGIVAGTFTDPRFRMFGEEKILEDWLTPLIQLFINRRIKEENFTVRVTSYTIPFVGYRKALSSLSFARDLIAGQHAL